MFDFPKVVITVFSILYCFSYHAFDPRGESRRGSADDRADRKSGRSRSYSAPSTNDLRDRVNADRARERSKAEAAIDRARQAREDSFRGRDDNDDNRNNNQNRGGGHPGIDGGSTSFKSAPEPKPRVSFAGIRGLANAAKNVATIAKNIGEKIITSNPHVEAYTRGVSRAISSVGLPPAEAGSNDDSGARAREDWADNYMREFYSGVARAYEAKGLKPELQPISSGPLDKYTKQAEIPRSPDYYDPRSNEGLYAGTGTRNPQDRASETIKTIDEHYRAGRIDLSLPGEKLNLTKTEVMGTGSKSNVHYDNNLLEDKLKDVISRDPIQAYGFLNSVTVVGDVSVLEEIANDLYGTTVTFSEDPNTGNKTSTITSSSMQTFGKNHNFGKKRSAPEFGYTLKVAGYNLPSQQLKGALPGGVNLIANTYTKIDRKITKNYKSIIDTFVHELKHAGDLAVWNNAEKELRENKNLSIEEKQRLEHVVNMSRLTRGSGKVIEDILNAERIKNNPLGNSIPDSKLVNLLKDNYYNQITELRAFTSQHYKTQDYAERISGVLGVSPAEAAKLVEEIQNSDTYKEIDRAVTDFATQDMNSNK